MASADDRLALVIAATDDVEGVEPSSIEIDRHGPTYTIDTLEQLTVPGRELFLILGSDAVHRLDTWHRWTELAARATIVVVERDGDTGANPPGEGWNVARVAIPRLDISSTDVRARVAAGRPIDGIVPPAVVREIHKRGLYTPA